MRILVNCERINVGKTLGVAHYTFKVLEAIKKNFNVEIICQVSPEMLDMYRNMPEICDYAFVKKFKFLFKLTFGRSFLRRAYRYGYHKIWNLFVKPYDIEYIPHHFQQSISYGKKVRVCFDLHVFDVPWKYNEFAAENFKKNIFFSSAVITVFIRPFKKLQTLIDDIELKIFHVDCPTLLGDIELEKTVVDKMKSKFNISDNNKILLYPAQLQKHKNHINLINAIDILKKAGNEIILICPGSDFKEEITVEIKQHIKKVQMEDIIFLPGYISSEELCALYHICSAVISPSLAEGGNMIAQEAISFDKPVACADTEPSRLQMEHMAAAIPLFDPHDPSSIAKAITEIISNGDSYVKKNQPAKNKIAGWTWNKTAERIMKIFKWVINDSPSHSKPLSYIV
jgi:glycosyltransferase involved in cell wall biosynthesis